MWYRKYDVILQFLKKKNLLGLLVSCRKKNRFPRPHHPEIYVIPKLLLRQIFCSFPHFQLELIRVS